ncbi:hypothetical protein [Aeoliella mucimassa]|uniref:Uncharacterized protein n=1 Tax=Aeoliella mucimassa TaxID=2527972 RepID=A0A518AHF7_9BACT|nr:hypothetical protein [Aeoliella mucimassa]QDU54125.1 hypothetical protein Pan181_03050 [Aeoliella mucimassa]
MSLDPKNYRTWKSLGEHPVFGPLKTNIESWSHDASQYGDLSNYRGFLPEWYVHLDPAPPVTVQIATAERDLQNLASVCCGIERAFGDICYELVVCDDFTVFVWVRHTMFGIELYPGLFGEATLLRMFVDHPKVDCAEFDFTNVSNVVETLTELLRQA